MKYLAVYLLLVGVPVAGIAAILHGGSRLHAPPHLSGEWRVEGMPLALDRGDTVAALSISQSGEHVEVTVGPRTLRGRFAGDSVAASRPAMTMDESGPCVSGNVRLDVRVDTAARPVRLWGTWLADEAGCEPVRFAATQTAEGGR